MKEINFKNVNEQDVRDLASHSELAKKFLAEADAIELFAVTNSEGISDNDVPFDEATLSFHPNGRCGTVLLNDNYMFSICCNHLMWADGDCELFGDNYLGAILVYGNHKGTLVSNMLVGFRYN